MKIAPLPANEAERIAELKSYGLLDSPPDTILDSITQTAADICGTSMALICLVDSERQWFKSNIGTSLKETHRDLAFCSHAILEPDKVLEIQDSALDERFHDNPIVTDKPGIRFYAGKPLVTRGGFALGTLCVCDEKPCELNAWQENTLRRLAEVVTDLLDERREFRVGANDELVEQDKKVESVDSQVVAPNLPSANNVLPNPVRNEGRALKPYQSRAEYRGMLDGLNCITSSAIEFDLLVEPLRLINFIDFYCVYLENTLRQSEGSPAHNIQLPAEPVTFLDFIFNQTLLTETAAIVEALEGQRVNTPQALKTSPQQ